MSFVIIPKKDPKKLQNLWAPSLTTVHISLVGWDQGDGCTDLGQTTPLDDIGAASVAPAPPSSLQLVVPSGWALQQVLCARRSL